MSSVPAPIPAPRSTTISSTCAATRASPSMSRSRCGRSRSARRAMPDAPGSNQSRGATVTKHCESCARPPSQSAAVRSGRTPQRRSRFARPRSASTSAVLTPRSAAAMAMPSAMVLLPTPPLPLATASVRASRGDAGTGAALAAAVAAAGCAAAIRSRSLAACPSISRSFLPLRPDQGGAARTHAHRRARCRPARPVPW